MRRAAFLLISFVSAFALVPISTRAHDDEDKPKSPTKALSDLKKARAAMDGYKSRLTKEGKYSCCIQRPTGSQVEGCDICAKTVGSCGCGSHLVQGKGVCGECFAGWKTGKGSKSFVKVDLTALKVLASDHQAIGEPQTMGQARPNQPEWETYLASISTAKRTLLEEKRYSCCVGNGGCDECAHEGYCPCGKRLAKDLDAKPMEKKRGVCGQCLDGQHGGHTRLGNTDLTAVVLAAMDEMMMKGALGPWNMNREGSGTSWLPEGSPMYGRMGQSGRYRTMLMGMAFASYTGGSGPRTESQMFFPSQYMATAQREIGGGTLGLRAMVSLDPLLIGGRGYPNLFQTGETYGGLPLKDRQHPHDLIMELAATYSTPLSDRVRGFVYLAPAGEPALGPAAFPHRPSAWDNPISPISHHWLDGTHITYGVASAGVAIGDRWKLDGSVFTGREPNENRYNIDPLRFDSYSGRLSFNPFHEWSIQGSYGFLRSPEATHPGNQHRFTASVHYNRSYSNGDNLALMLAYGRNISPGEASRAWLVEGAYRRGRLTAFGRFDDVWKDELVAVPAGGYRVKKVTIGTSYNIREDRQAEHGVGGSLDFYSFPSSLGSAYGSNPMTFNLFYRIRFGKM